MLPILKTLALRFYFDKIFTLMKLSINQNFCNILRGLIHLLRNAKNEFLDPSSPLCNTLSQLTT
jgi:hypothetical protein